MVPQKHSSSTQMYLSRGRCRLVRAVQDADGLAVAVPQGRQLRRAVPAQPCSLPQDLTMAIADVGSEISHSSDSRQHPRNNMDAVQQRCMGVRMATTYQAHTRCLKSKVTAHWVTARVCAEMV